MKFIAPLLIAATLVTGASASTTVFQSVEKTFDNVGTTFSFDKFNGSLGTLTGISFSIVSSVDSGSFYVRNNTGDVLTVKTPKDYLTLVDNQSSGADYDGANITLVSTPPTGTAGYALAGNSSQTFTITNKSLIGTGTINTDLSSYLAAYTGTGSVTFDAAIAPTVLIQGGSATFDMSGISNTSVLTLTYVYDAIPEPSVAMLGGLGALALLRRRRN